LSATIHTRICVAAKYWLQGYQWFVYIPYTYY